MKHTAYLLLLFLFSYSLATAQSTLDKLILEDAQIAYANNKYYQCLEKIAELEQRGNKGLIILHLKIMATSKTTIALLDYDQVVQFKKDVAYYLENYDNEDFIEQYRDVYEVSKTLSSQKYSEGYYAVHKAVNYYDEKDYVNALQWYLKADGYGYVTGKGAFYIAYMYANGLGTEQNYSEAVKWYTKAANKGSVSAQNNLALLYEKGKGIEKDIDKAIMWYTKAAHLGSPSAQYKLGGFFKNGEGTDKDIYQALMWFTKAAEQGYVRAYEDMGNIYFDGDDIEKDLPKAIDYYKKAIALGGINMYGIGKAYEELGDYQEAHKYFLKGKETGQLGFYSYEGKVGLQDYSQAVQYWESYAEDFEIGKLLLAVACFVGKGTEQNIEKAWLLFSATLEKYGNQLTKEYLKNDGAYIRNHFPHYAQDEAVFFEYLAKEHNIVFEN